MHWLPWPVMPKLQWPAVRYKDKRAITLEEHLTIVSREQNAELRAYYELLWHLGAAQSDLGEPDGGRRCELAGAARRPFRRH